MRCVEVCVVWVEVCGVWRCMWRCVEVRVEVCGGACGVWRCVWCVEVRVVCGGACGVWRCEVMENRMDTTHVEVDTFI